MKQSFGFHKWTTFLLISVAASLLGSCGGDAGTKMGSLADTAGLGPDKKPTAEEAAGACVDNENVKQAVVVVQKMVQGAGKKLPVDITPYLLGLCVPDDSNKQAVLFEYLATEGALHGAATGDLISEMVQALNKAGVEMTFSTPEFATEEALRKMKGDRLEGVTALLEAEFRWEDILEHLPRALKKVGKEHKTKILELAGEARGHSIASLYYLARSGYLGVNVGKNPALIKVAKFVTTNRDGIVDMLVGVASVVKTFSTQIKDVPRVSQQQIEERVSALRQDNDIDLDDVEQESAEAQKQGLGKLF